MLRLKTFATQCSFALSLTFCFQLTLISLIPIFFGHSVGRLTLLIDVSSTVSLCVQLYLQLYHLVHDLEYLST
jgi:hypothetical protein